MDDSAPKLAILTESSVLITKLLPLGFKSILLYSALGLRKLRFSFVSWLPLRIRQ